LESTGAARATGERTSNTPSSGWSHWPGYGYADLAKITVPTLILVGDRDLFCSVEEAAVAFRNLAHGQLAVIPNLGHVISSGKIEALVSFLTS
jgi:pimeloyl-ACP methyl ester carboxylesterase